MATNIARLAADLAQRLKISYRTPPPANEELNEDYWLNRMANDIATAILNELTTNAKCSGTDSHGDSHDNVGIV
jgi:hypothetical protein